jgi:propionyl-CoA synthetase
MEDAMNIQGKSRYHEVHARSLRDPEGFWAEAAREIDWIEPAKKVFDPDQGLYGRWFVGGVVNTCYNALDRQVASGRANQLALIHDSPLAGHITKLTYAEMLQEVKTLAAIMQDFGVAKGDRVILYMPMVPEAMVAMLACARIGAVHSVVFGGFAAKELATRIEDGRSTAASSSQDAITIGQTCALPPSGRGSPPTASPFLRPIRSTSSTRRARRASLKAWCATMAGIWSR